MKQITVDYHPTSTLTLGDQIDESHYAWDCQHDGDINYEAVCRNITESDGRDMEWSEQRAYCADCDKDLTEEVLL